MNKDEISWGVLIIGLLIIVTIIGMLFYTDHLNKQIHIKDCVIDCDNEGFTFETYTNGNYKACWCNNPTDGHPVEIPVR